MPQAAGEQDGTLVVHTLNIDPGIKRDGTQFDARNFSDGIWTRFMRGRPRKMGGYRKMFAGSQTPRGMISNSQSGVNYVYTGNQVGMEVLTTGTNQGAGAGPFTVALAPAFVKPTAYTNAQLVPNQSGGSFQVDGDQRALFAQGTQVAFPSYTPTNANGTAYGTTLNVSSPIAIPVGAILSGQWVINNDPVTGAESNLSIGSQVQSYTINGTSATIELTVPIQSTFTYNSASPQSKTNEPINFFNNDSFFVVATALYDNAANKTTVNVLFYKNTYGAPTIPVTPTSGTLYIVRGLLTDATSPDPRLTWQFDIMYDPSGLGQLKLIAHGGFNLQDISSAEPSPVYAGSFYPVNGVYYMTPLIDSQGSNPTGDAIFVDGGVVCLYPYIFAYGSNGLLQNNHVDNSSAGAYGGRSLSNWNGPSANINNMAAAKIVKGIPLRGGASSPAGLFFATDSLIRVSFNPTQIGTQTISGQQYPLYQYWRYEVIDASISIMSSNCIVSMDGNVYWLGVDRFYLYNGSVQVLPNDINLNYFFDNLNYEQRQKVWATKVPRYNEIWFFYPRGTSTECNDAIIYNVKDQIWYDAGLAEGARRSCGFFTEIFPWPIWAGWEPQTSVVSPSYAAKYATAVDLDATYNNGAVGVGATLTSNTNTALVIDGASPAVGDVILVKDQSVGSSPQYELDGLYTVTATGSASARWVLTRSQNYDSGNKIKNHDVVQVQAGLQNAGTQWVLNLSNPSLPIVVGVTGLHFYSNAGTSIYTVQSYPIWQQEFTWDKIDGTTVSPVLAQITTCDISWTGGNPGGDKADGVNRQFHLIRVEPDFKQTGPMTLRVHGRGYANENYTDDGDMYTFTDATPKIDIRKQYRQMTLTFESNTSGGFFEMGRTILTADLGDERPSGDIDYYGQ